jgi:hypothetical protein
MKVVKPLKDKLILIIFKRTVLFKSRKSHHVTRTNASVLIIFGEIVALYSENQIKPS